MTSPKSITAIRDATVRLARGAPGHDQQRQPGFTGEGDAHPGSVGQSRTARGETLP